MGRRCLRLCNASLRWATVRCWERASGSGSVALTQLLARKTPICTVTKSCSLHLTRASTLNLLNVPTDVKIYIRPSRQPAMLISLVESWWCSEV